MKTVFILVLTALFQVQCNKPTKVSRPDPREQPPAEQGDQATQLPSGDTGRLPGGNQPPATIPVPGNGMNGNGNPPVITPVPPLPPGTPPPSAGMPAPEPSDPAPPAGNLPAPGPLPPASEPTGDVHVFWLNFGNLGFSGGQVYRAAADGSGAKGLAKTGTAPDGIAVDAAGGKIYWSNMGSPLGTGGGSLQRSNLDGSGVEEIVSARATGTRTPKQIQLDVKGRHVYWCDREGAKVFRASMDKANDAVVLASGSRFDQLVGIALDPGGQKIYFTDRNKGIIYRMGMAMPAGSTAANRSDIEEFIRVGNPIDLDLDLEAGLIYWTDRKNGKIYSAGLSNPSTSTKVLVDGLNEPIGIALDGEGNFYFTELGLAGGGKVWRAAVDGTGRKAISGNANYTGVAVARF